MNHQPSTIATDLDALPLFAAAAQSASEPFAVAVHTACNGPLQGVPTELRRALAILATSHLGGERAILGDDLAAAAGYDGSGGANGTRVRRFRADLAACFSRLPVPVAANTAGGYYIPVTGGEIAHYRADLRSRARHILERAMAFERQLDHTGHPGAAAEAEKLERLIKHTEAV